MGSSMLGQIDRKDVESRLLRFVGIDSVNPCTKGGAGESELAAAVEADLRGLGVDPVR